MLSALRRLWGYWKAFSVFLGDSIARIILTFIYFIFLAPFWLIGGLFTDPLQLKPARSPSYWIARPRQVSEQQEVRRR